MVGRKRILAGVILAAVYAFFFASTNFFYHSHIFANQKIVHSHPWSGAAHSHSSDQISIIAAADNAVYEGVSSFETPGFVAEFSSCIVPLPKTWTLQKSDRGLISLRAPPAAA